jgi:chromosome segregation ATPase
VLKLKKKIIKRLAYYNDLNNLGYDNEKIYDTVIEYIEDINGILDNNNILDNDIPYDIKRIYEDIHIEIETAKGYGQDNEDALKEGNGIISDLEEEIRYTQDQISNIQSEINDIQYEIDNFNYANSRLRKLYKETINKNHLEKESKFICTTHDEIMSFCNEGVEICNKFSDKYGELDDEDKNYEKQLEDLFSEFDDKIRDKNTDIERYIDEARDSNERMSNGIESKNSKIYNLNEELEELQNNLRDKENELSDKKYELNSMK